MNIVTNNIFKHQIIKHNRIGNKIISKEMISYKDFCFNGSLYSIKYEDEKFTNFVKSYEKKIFLELKKILNKIDSGESTLETEFKLVDNEIGIGKKQRLDEIIKYMHGIEIVPDLMKLKPNPVKNDQTLDGVRIYVYYDKENEEFNLYLIDLYHLAVEGKNYKLGEKGRYDLKHRYEMNSKHNKCISKISDNFTYYNKKIERDN